MLLSIVRGTRRGEARAPSARHATHRAWLDRPGAPAVSVEPPGWVRDAIFYQVFPDRFASSERVHKPGPLEAVGQPADRARLQGRRPAGHRRASRLPRGLRGQCAVPHADLRVGLEPPLPHRTTTSRSTPCWVATTPCASCSTPPTTAGSGSSSMACSTTRDAGSGRSTTSSRRVPRHPIATGSTSTTSGSTRASRWSPTRRPGRRRAPSATRRGGACRPCPSSIPTSRRCASTCSGSPSTGSASGSTAGGSTCPGEIDDEAFWQEFRARCRAVRPDAYLVGEIWRVAPDWLRGDRFDALMNYPLGEAILGFAGGSHLDMGVIALPSRVLGERPSARRSGLWQAAHGARRGLRPGRPAGPAQPARLARHATGFERCSGAASTGSCSRRCSR